MDSATLTGILLTGLVSGTGAGLITLLVAYPKAKSELQAQFQAKFENMAFLMREEFEKARQQEAGKRAAIHADIENVLNEVRLVTKETELIRTEIGTNAWTRERVWEQKRDAYFKVLNRTNQHVQSLKHLHAYRKGVWAGAKREGIDLSTVAPIPNQSEDFLRAYADSHSDLSHSLIEAYLFVSPIAHPLLNECINSVHFGSAFGIVDGKRANLDRTEQEQIEVQEKGAQEMNFLGVWMGRLLTCARKDLHVDGTPHTAIAT
jgi:hypothetical protein